MPRPTTVFLAKFRTGLPFDEARRVVEERMDAFRALPGLLQKYYLRETATGEVAGLYFWESPEALSEFAQSELRATIAEAYEVEGEPRVEVFEIFDVLREESAVS